VPAGSFVEKLPSGSFVEKLPSGSFVEKLNAFGDPLQDLVILFQN